MTTHKKAADLARQMSNWCGMKNFRFRFTESRKIVKYVAEKGDHHNNINNKKNAQIFVS